MADGNGSGPSEFPKNLAQMVITFDREKCVCDVQGRTQNIHEALNMLRMATWELENQLRTEQAKRILDAPLPVPFLRHPQGRH